MKIANFDIEGYGVWSGLRVERLTDSLNVFYGPNEAGKTTLLQFIRSMLYGFSPRRRRYFPPLHGGRPGGAIEVAGPNGRFQIERYYIDTDADGAPGEQLTLTAPDGTRQGEHFLKVLLSNVDEAVFNNVFAIGLREMQELSTLGGTDAAELLYNLTVGLDRVSLVDVLRELEISRNRLLDVESRPCLVLQLSAERRKLLAEIEELSSINHRYARLAAEYGGINAEITRLEEEANRAERLAEVMDLAAAVRDRWQRRAELDEQLAALGPQRDMPPRAIERLDALNARIDERRQRIDRIARQRKELRREFASLAINEALRRQTARIEAIVEQEPWIARLQSEIGELEAEIGKLEPELTTEAAQLGLSNVPVALPSPSSGELRSLRTPARALRESLGRLNEAKQEAESARSAIESLGRQIQSSLTALGEHDLTAALERAEGAVSQSRRRAQIDERIEQQIRYQTELEDRSRMLVDRQLLPAWVLIGLGAMFVVGVVLLLTGLFMPESVVGTAGWTLAILGLAGSGAAAFAKVMLERSNVHQLDACRKQLELVREQIRQANEERDLLDARMPGEGPVSSRLQSAQRELAALEELSPLDLRRGVARQEAEAASRRAVEAREVVESARRRWRAALAAAGMPEDMSPKQLQRLTRHGDRIVDMQRRLNERREELLRRRREMESLAARIAQLTADAGSVVSAKPQAAGFSDPPSPNPDLRIPSLQPPASSLPPSLFDPIGQLRSLSEAAAKQQTAVARREAIRRQARRNRTAATRYEESIGRLNHRRRELFIEAGVKDEQEYRRRALEQARGDVLRGQRETLTHEIDSALASRCSEEAIRQQLDGADAPALDQRREEVRRQVSVVRGQLGGLLERRGRLSEQLETLAGDKQLASKRLELAVLEKRLQDAVARWQMLATASRVLDAIRETYEQHRQPETLREASSYLERLTGGRYCRVWTPLGEHSLRIDDAEGRSLQVEALSRGTREQLFLSLRLALAGCYARRGAQLPLVLDDVLVNFDADRAKAAVAVLRDFAAAGHQLLVFTCHEHILKLFKSLKTAVGRLPDNSEPGQVVTLEVRKVEETPKREKRSAAPRRAAAAKTRKPKSKPRKIAEIEVVEDDGEEEEQIDDDSLWEEEDEADDDDFDDADEINAAA